MQQFLRDAEAWVRQHPGWILGVTIGSFIGSLIALRFVIARLPEDYFMPPEQRAPTPPRNAWQWLLVIVRNLLGAILVLGGIAMLVLPGQGVLTLIMGMSLLSFPGRQRLLCKLTRAKKVRRSLQFFRRHVGCAPLRFEDMGGSEDMVGSEDMGGSEEMGGDSDDA